MKKLNKKGFTLIELVVVMAIIAVLAVLIIGAIIFARRTSQETTHRGNAKTIQTAIESAYAKNKRYCASSATSGEATCSTTASFSTVAQSSQLGVTLSSGCTTANYEQGGQINVSAQAYTITPRNYDCSADLGTTDIIKVGQ